MRGARLGALGAIVALIVVVSLILSAFFCTFPWSMTARAGTAGDQDSTAGKKHGTTGEKPLEFELRTLGSAGLQAAPDSTEVRTQIDAGNAVYLRAWKNGDAELFASCFAPGGALLQPGRTAAVGHELIRQRMKSAFERFRATDGAIVTVSVFILGDEAYESGKARFTIGPVGKTATPDSGLFVKVWKADASGAWKIWRDIGVPRE